MVGFLLHCGMSNASIHSLLPLADSNNPVASPVPATQGEVEPYNPSATGGTAVNVAQRIKANHSKNRTANTDRIHSNLPMAQDAAGRQTAASNRSHPCGVQAYK